MYVATGVIFSNFTLIEIFGELSLPLVCPEH